MKDLYRKEDWILGNLKLTQYSPIGSLPSAITKAEILKLKEVKSHYNVYQSMENMYISKHNNLTNDKSRTVYLTHRKLVIS